MTSCVVRCILVAGWLGVLGGNAAAFQECGSLRNAYGPYDYWTDKDKLDIVEIAHFTPEVEHLRAGKSGPLGGDIDYTLRAFPNHPRALLSMMRLGEQERTERPRGVNYPVPCYFDRAIRFRPKDPMAHMVYATYLAKAKKNGEALEHLRVAQETAGDNANLHYNLGLVYTDLGQFDKALEHAHKAYRLGFSLPGLKMKLQKAGKWQELAATGIAGDRPAHAEDAAPPIEAGALMDPKEAASMPKP